MYKNLFRRVQSSSSSSNVPKPVVLSQKRPQEVSEVTDKENQQEDVVPSSQNVMSSQDVFNDVPMNEDVISQSRFLSQRHRTRPTQENQIKGKNYFEIALVSSKMKVTEIGCELDDGDDPISFTRRFRAFISSSSVERNNENAKKFIDGFKAAFNLKESIKEAQKFLTGCIMKESQKTVQSHTSMIQCFFSVSSLKDQIAKILLDNLQKYVSERGELADGFIVGLVVAQFKFSDQMLTKETYNSVYERFFEILKATKSDACRETIIENFRDLDEFKQDEAVKRLLQLYEDEQENLTPFIEMFTEMNLSEETKVTITSLIQHLLENNCDQKLYPAIVKYLLHYMSSAESLVKCLRKKFKWSARSNVRSEVVQLLEKSVRHEKSKMSQAWMKIVSNSEKPEDENIIDFVMLLAIVSVSEEKLPIIKKILIQNISAGLFGAEFMRKCFRTFTTEIVQYSETLLELLNALQKSNIHEINEFSSICFKELFSIELSDKKEIVGSLVQFLCEKTSFSIKSDFKMMTLTILDEIAKDQSTSDALLINHKILLRVLDIGKVKLTVNEHRMMLELLCALAYTTNYKETNNDLVAKRLEEEQAVLQEHLDMMAQKLITNPDLSIKQLGIIASVKIISAQVVNVVMSSDVQGADISIDDIPAGPVKEAAKRVVFMLGSVKENAIGLGVVYDELALEFAGKGDQIEINEIFLIWLCEMIFEKLGAVAGIALDVELPEIENLTLAHKFPGKDFSDASQPEYALQLGRLVFQTKSDDPIFIPALFKLARVLQLHRAHSLNDVGLFATMPITVTETFDSPEDEISVDAVLAKQQLDLYFYCINWLRELVGAYCHQTEKDGDEFSLIVVKRLKQLVSVEKRLNQLLMDMPSNYYPPPATFLDIEQKKKLFDSLRKEKKVTYKPTKPPKKTRKKNDATIVNATTIASSNQFEMDTKIRLFCREIDTHAIVLLKRKFNFRCDDIPEDEFGLQELVFILLDVYCKVKPIFTGRCAEQKGFFDPIKALNDVKNSILTELVEIFYNSCEAITSLSQQADEEDSNDVFYAKDANMVKCCFSLILQVFEVFFSCPKLKLEKHRDLVNETLAQLIPNDAVNNDDIYTDLVNHFISLQGNVKNIESAVALVSFLQTVTKLNHSDQLHSLVLELCENFLKKEWKNSNGEDEHGAIFNANLEKLLQIYTENEKFGAIEMKFQQMFEDFKFIVEGKLEFQKTFPSFNKGNSILMMRAYLTRLSIILLTLNPNQMDSSFWLKCTKIYVELIAIVKCIGLQNTFIAFLKDVLIYIRTFNAHGIQALKLIVKDKKKFLEIVKNSQTVTRFSHSVSCDLKHRKNKSVVAIIPKLREALMKNFQSLSALIPLAQSKIFLGSLKNFDINNEDIWSQNTSSNASSMDRNEMEEDEEDVSMNVSDDETIGNLIVDSDPPQSIRSRSTIL